MVDSGNLLAPGRFVNSAERYQRQVKARLLLEASVALGVDAMTVGDADFAFGKEFLVNEAARSKAPYLAANLVDATTGAPLFPSGKLVTLGNLKVGIIGVVPEALEVEGVTSLPPIPAAKEAARALQAQGAELIVALANGTFATLEQLGREVPGVEIIVSAGTRQMLEQPRVAGNALILEAGARGKHVGMLEVTRMAGASGWDTSMVGDSEKEKRARLKERVKALGERLQGGMEERERERVERQLTFYQQQLTALGPEPKANQVKTAHHVFKNALRPLSRDIPDDPDMVRRVQAALDVMNNPPPGGELPGAESAGATLTQGDGANSGASASAGLPVATGFGDLVGAEACASCHAEETKQWKTTGHARAYTSLEREKRHLDYQCFSCHIDGYFQPDGPKKPDAIGSLKHVGCESCHQGGKKHIQNPVAAPLPAKVPEKVCLECHTPEQTEGRFDYATYLPKVRHRSVGVAPAAGTGAVHGQGTSH